MPLDFTSDLNMGAPWAELSGIGGPPDQAEQTPPELQKNLDSMRNFGAQSAVAAKASSAPSPPDKISISTDPTGKKMVKVETSLENYEGTTRSAMNWHQALGGVAKQMEQNDQRLAQQEAAARNQPAWVQLATALSANLAQGKDMPGWVQGLGRTAAQLNPQPDQIAAQRMALLGPRMDLAEKAASMELSVAREKRLASHEETALGMQQQRFAYGMAQDKTKNEQNVEEKWDDRATKGFFDAAAYSKELKAANPKISDDEIKALVVGKQALAAQSDTLREKLGAAKFKEFEKEQGLKFNNEVKMAGIDHRNKMEEIVAKAKGTMNPKTGKPFTQFELKEIAELETTGILVENLVRDLDEHPDLFGPMPQTRARTWVKSFFDEGTSRVRADYAHALPIMVQLLREGTRGYARNQREWVESKVPNMTDTPERLRGKLAFMKGFLDARQKGLDAVFVTQDMARTQQSKGLSPFPAPASAHAPAVAKTEEDVWTPERVAAERKKQSGGR